MEHTQYKYQAEIKQDERFYTYIIQGKHGWLYCGITNNIVRRLIEHNQGQSLSTRFHAPYVLKWIHESKSRKWARWVEVLIKRNGVNNYLLKSKWELLRRGDRKLLERYGARIILQKENTANSQQPTAAHMGNI